MANLVIRGGIWTPSNHRHHHAAPGGEFFDIDTVPGVSGQVDAVAQQHEDGRTFVFWSWSGATEINVSTDPEARVTYPAGTDPATLTRWYLTDGIGRGQAGVYFDAFSEQSGDFLDWGDEFDPFTVNPAAARDDAFAATAAGMVSVTAAGVWPGGGLVLTDWLVVSGTAATASTEVSVPANQSAIAIARYAQPSELEEPVRNRIPPILYRPETGPGLAERIKSAEAGLPSTPRAEAPK